MKLIDALHLLSVAAYYDNRKPSESEAGVWMYDLNQHRITPEEATAAIREHYQHNPDTWIKAGHVIGIVKRRRTAGGIAHSAELEAAILRQVPDPDDTRAVIDAIHRARELAAKGEATPTRLAITSKYESSADKQARLERGAPAAREVAAAALRKAPRIRRGRSAADDGVTEAVQSARERAAEEAYTGTVRHGRGGEPEPLSGLLDRHRRPS